MKELTNYQIKFLIECDVIRHELKTNEFSFGYLVESTIFEPSVFSITAGNYSRTLLSMLDNSRDLFVNALQRGIKDGIVTLSPNAEEIYNQALISNSAKEFEKLDGAIGIVRDVSKEEWFQNPKIELYDEIEADAFALACKCAEIIGVTMDKDEIDFSIAKPISEATIKILEETFGISFPCYGD